MSLIYDLGTEIIICHCFATKIINSFYKSIIPEDYESSRRDLAFYSIKTWFKAFWDFFLFFLFWKNSIFGIWNIQNVEQVYLVSDPILPASETFNQTFKNVNYCKNMEIYMRPWIRSLFLMISLTSKASFWKMNGRYTLNIKIPGSVDGSRTHSGPIAQLAERSAVNR